MKQLARKYDTQKVVELTFDENRLSSISECADNILPTDQIPWLAPGFIDIQINGYGGHDFSSAELTIEKVETIIAAHDPFGIAKFCPTLTTNSFETINAGLKILATACEQSAENSYRILGIHVEGPYISKEDGPRGAHPLEHCRPPDWDEFQRWQETSGGRICLFTLSPEYDNAPSFIKKAVDSGVAISIAHTSANSQQIRKAVDAGAILSTHLGNGSHGQIRRHPNYIWDQLAEDRLTASLIVDGFHLPPEVVQTFVRAKTPSRCILVSDEGSLAGLPPGKYDCDSLVPVEILEDGRLVVAGQRQLLAGASLPIGVGIANIVRFSDVDLQTAVNMATRWPAELLGFEHQGLTNKLDSDFVLFEFDESSGAGLTVQMNIVQGKIIYQQKTE